MLSAGFAVVMSTWLSTCRIHMARNNAEVETTPMKRTLVYFEKSYTVDDIAQYVATGPCRPLR